MIKIIPLIFHCFTFFCALGLLSSSLQAQFRFLPEQIAYLQKKQVLKVCVDPAYEPMEKINAKGEHVGIAADFIALISKKTGLQIQLHRTATWQESLNAGKSKECDFFSLVAKTKQRESYLYFTKSYLTLQNALIGHESEPFISNISQLKGKKIGVVNGYATHDILKAKYPELNFVPVPSTPEGLLQLKSGDIDYLNDYLSSASFYIGKLAISQIRVVGVTDLTLDLGFASRKDEPILRDILNIALQSVTESEKNQILQKWVSIDVEPKVGYQLIILIASFSSIIILLFVAWNKQLSSAKIKLLTEAEERQKSEEQLLVIMNKLKEERNLFISGSVVVFRWRNEENWPVEYVSPNIQDFLGYAAEEFKEQKKLYSSLLIPEEVEQITAEVTKAIEAGISRFEHQPYRLVARDGSLKWVQDVTNIIRNEEGEITQFYGFLADITSLMDTKSQLSTSEERLQFAIEGTGDGLWDWNLMTGAMFFSAGWYRILGRDSSYPITTVEDWQALIHPEDLSSVLAARMENFQQRTDKFRSEYRILHQDSHWVWVLDRGKVVEFNTAQHPVRVIGTCSDIGQQKASEKKLNIAKIAAEKATNAKSNFLANMSHEIRTPMNAILGMTHLSLDEEIPPHVREYLDIVQTSSNNLLQIINDILDISKIEAGKIHIEIVTFNLFDEITQLTEMFAVTANKKKIKLIAHVDPTLPQIVQGDLTHLKQVLINLLGNALKFTRRGAVNLNLKVLVTQQDKSLVEFHVQDSGIGISPEDQKIIFHNFTQAQTSTNREFGGTGLGLSISKQLTEMMGGELSVSSNKGEGSTFQFSIWLETPKTAKLDLIPDISHSGNLKGMKILLVEDIKVNQLLIERFCGVKGIEVTTVENGKLAIEILQKEPFDVILMDIQMPVMDGLTATQKIRDPETKVLNPKIPIIALTANVFAEDRKKYLEAGMDEFMPKPIQQNLLYQLLEESQNLIGRGAEPS